MKTVLNIAGALLLITGVVWALQGANMLGGSFMTGERQWLWIGIACIVGGAGLLIIANRSAIGRRRG